METASLTSSDVDDLSPRNLFRLSMSMRWPLVTGLEILVIKGFLLGD